MLLEPIRGEIVATTPAGSTEDKSYSQLSQPVHALLNSAYLPSSGLFHKGITPPAVPNSNDDDIGQQQNVSDEKSAVFICKIYQDRQRTGGEIADDIQIDIDGDDIEIDIDF